MNSKGQAMETTATNDKPGNPEKATRAQHGAASEVNWNGGRGRQPYANQGAEETGEAGGEFAEGDRGELSGRNLDQLAEVRRKP
jgi:hypothetical protein